MPMIEPEGIRERPDRPKRVLNYKTWIFVALMIALCAIVGVATYVVFF